MNKWQEIFAREQRKLPRGASRYERGQAAKRASRIYRGGQLKKEVQSNPMQRDDLLKWGVVAVVAYFGYQWIKGGGLANVQLPPPNQNTNKSII